MILLFDQDLAFTQSLMDLLYLDIWPYLDLTGKIGDNIQELRESGKYETSCEIKSGLQELVKSHFYFELARIEWDQRLEKVADQSYNEIFNLLPYKKITHIPSDIQTMQSQIKSLLLSVLDILSPDEPVQKKMVDYIHEIRQTFRVNIDAFYFTKLTTTFEQVDAEHVAEVLRPKDVHEIIEFFLRACVQREQRFRVCKNCGKIFCPVRLHQHRILRPALRRHRQDLQGDWGAQHMAEEKDGKPDGERLQQGVQKAVRVD